MFFQSTRHILHDIWWCPVISDVFGNGCLSAVSCLFCVSGIWLGELALFDLWKRCRPLLPCLASSGLHLSLLLSLHSDPKHSHSAVHPQWRWKIGLRPPNPPPDCFNNTLLVNSDVNQGSFVSVSVVFFVFFSLF